MSWLSISIVVRDIHVIRSANSVRVVISISIDAYSSNLRNSVSLKLSSGWEVSDGNIILSDTSLAKSDSLSESICFLLYGVERWDSSHGSRKSRSVVL